MRLGVDHRADVGGQLAGSPTRSSASAPREHLDHGVGDALVHAQQAQRRAALAGRAERALHDGIDHLLGQRGAVDDHRVDAAGLGDQRHDRAVLRGQAAVDRLATAVEPVKHTPAVRASATSAAPTVSPGPCSSASASRGTPASCSSATKRAATAGVCSAGLAATRVAGDERRHHLAGEDREREVPRADADEHAAAVQAQLVAFAGRARAAPAARGAFGLRRRSSGRSRPPRAPRPRSRPASCGLRDEQAAELGQARFERVGGAAQHARARSASGVAFQAGEGRAAGAPSRVDLRRRRLGDRRHDARAPTRALQRRALGHARRGRRPRELRRARAVEHRAAAAGPAPRPARSGDAQQRVDVGTASSASWCTNDELAPFSSSRRTR